MEMHPKINKIKLYSKPLFDTTPEVVENYEAKCKCSAPHQSC